MARALVTGGGSGIGAACATALERDGWEVVRADLIATDGVVPLDVTDEAAVDGLFAAAGPFAAVVCSAGIRTGSMIVDTDLAEWERHLRVNVTGTWLAIRAFLRHAATDPTTPRAVVTIASVSATIAVPNQAHYVASKGAVVGLTRAAALEGAPVGVRVNAIAPGAIRTPLTAGRLADPAQVEWLGNRIPLGRVGEAHEIADLAAFLVSPRASYISGEVVTADGGWAVNAV